MAFKAPKPISTLEESSVVPDPSGLTPDAVPEPVLPAAQKYDVKETRDVLVFMASMGRTLADMQKLSVSSALEIVAKNAKPAVEAGVGIEKVWTEMSEMSDDERHFLRMEVAAQLSVGGRPDWAEIVDKFLDGGLAFLQGVVMLKRPAVPQE